MDGHAEAGTSVIRLASMIRLAFKLRFSSVTGTHLFQLVCGRCNSNLLTSISDEHYRLQSTLFNQSRIQQLGESWTASCDFTTCISSTPPRGSSQCHKTPLQRFAPLLVAENALDRGPGVEKMEEREQARPKAASTHQLRERVTVRRDPLAILGRSFEPLHGGWMSPL